MRYMSKVGRMTSAYESGSIPQIQVHHRLRIAREWANLEQAELADRMGVSRQSIGSAENGRTKPRRITLNAWALACGVPVQWLIDGGADPANDPDRNGPTGGQPTGMERARPFTADIRYLAQAG